MAYTLADLLSPPTEAQLTTTLLSALSTLGFPVSSWPVGGAGRTLVQGFARVTRESLVLVSNVARGSLLDLAPGTDPGSPGDWLSLLAKSAYQLDRRQATFAKVKVRLTAASGAGPYTITPGQLWAVSSAGRRYNSTNTANVTVSAGPSTVDIEMIAENPGSAYNLGVGATLTLETPLPGVTALTIETSGGSGTPMVSAGVDAENDATLRARCKSRWQTIGLQKTADAYDALARSAPSAADATVFPVTRTKVDDTNPRGAGTVNLWIAGASGPLTTPDRDAVRDYCAARKSVCVDLQTENATATPVNVTATIYVRGNSGAKAEAEARLTAAINAVPIGGIVYLAQLLEELMTPTGVYNAIIASPTADVVLAANGVATVGTLTITQVST